MRHSILSLCSFYLLLFGPALSGQSNKALLRELAEENKKSVEALALYPSETRLAILEAVKYPEILIKMNNTRQKTAAAYQTLIEDFPRTTQELMYELTRYPGLLNRLTAPQTSDAAQREALKQLPEKQRAAAFDLVQNQIRTLLKINELQQTAQAVFTELIDPYPAPARAAFQQLVELPEVLEILNEDLRFSIMVGDLYKTDPAWVIHKMDSLNLAVARTHAEELDEWKNTIENDPQAQQELETASQAYAQEYGYESAVYEDDDLYYERDYNQPTTIVVHHYPWWFGYPWWYPAPSWRPYPWWYDWGFQHQQRFVIVYMPSWHFMHWYFNRPHHHYQYSHLSTHFVNHYNGHRRSGSSISMGVGTWREQNKAVLSEDWLSDKKRLPERLKEYGHFEENRTAQNKRNPNTAQQPDVFLERNKQKYPELARAQVAQANQRKQTEPPEKPSEWAPRKEPRANMPNNTEPSKNPRAEKALKPRTEKPLQPTPSVPIKPKEQPSKPGDKRNIPTQERPVEKANEYHRQKWEENKQEEKVQPSRPASPISKPQPEKRTAKPKTMPGRGN